MTSIQPLTSDIINAWADNTKGPVALMLKQRLLPIDGEGGIIFPPTYADIGYSIDVLSDGSKVAQIDSVASQANRLEPLFKSEECKSLVPQIEFELGKDETGAMRRVSLLDLAHRAGDAVVRSSDLAVKIDSAFKTMLRKHDATPLAKLAPTSLLFGAWDSRGTQVKRPRLIRACIRADDIDILHGAAQFNSIWKLLDDQQKDELKKATPKGVKLSDKGFNDVPSIFRKTNMTKTNKDGQPNEDARVLGGVIANGPISRQVTINLIAIYSLHGADVEATKKLRRYLLGLALVAATADMEFYLREGCLLKYADAEEERWEAIARRGPSQFYALSSEEDRKTIFAYAQQAADDFGIFIPEKSYVFDIKKAKTLLAKKEDADTDAEV